MNSNGLISLPLKYTKGRDKANILLRMDKGGKLKREEFILNDLDALGGDIKALVEAEYLGIHEAQERWKAQQEAKKRDKTIGVLVEAHTLNWLKPELNYFLARLHTMITYLSDESQSPGHVHI